MQRSFFAHAVAVIVRHVLLAGLTGSPRGRFNCLCWAAGQGHLAQGRAISWSRSPLPACAPRWRGFALFALVCDVPLSAQEAAAPNPRRRLAPSSRRSAPSRWPQLVAPIALYPDTLLGQILTASTYPLEVVKAARWSRANPKVKGEALESAMQQQPWDPSVKALAAVPQVLAMMSDKLEWTQSLGDAYLAQPDDIAAAVQQLRARADAAGNLKSSNEQRIRRVAAPAPVNVDEPPAPDYYIIEPVDPDIIYVPIYDPYVVYGVWPYPAYRPFYWYPPGYVTVGVFALGAPIAVGAALWATYDWRARRVAIDVNRFNAFNRTTIVSQTWQHNPVHRGNLRYSNPALQQQFSKTATGVQGLSKTGIGSQELSKTGRGSQGMPKGGMVTNPQSLPKGTTTKTGPESVNVNRNVNLGNTKNTGSAKTLNAVNPNLNKNVNVTRNVNVNPNVSGNLNVHRNVGLPKGNVGAPGVAKGAAKGFKPKGQP